MTPEPVQRRDFMTRVSAMECEITDEEGRLVAKASSTCMVLTGHRAKGR